MTNKIYLFVFVMVFHRFNGFHSYVKFNPDYTFGYNEANASEYIKRAMREIASQATNDEFYVISVYQPFNH